jgi:hypothetical protein
MNEAYTWLRRLPHGYWTHMENRILYLRWLGERLGFASMSDWYSLKVADFRSNHGHGVMRFYKGSPLSAVREMFPEAELQPWMFGFAPRHYWKDQTNRLKYLRWLGAKLEYATPNDWYSVKADDFRKNYGLGLLSSYYRDSPVAALQELYPEEKWLPWLFSSCPNGYWRNPLNRRKYLEWLGYKLGYLTQDDWYHIEWRDFVDNAGQGLLVSHFGGSPSKAVMQTFREYEWHPWLFARTHQHFWKDKRNRIDYLKWIGRKNGFHEAEDWYALNYLHFQNAPSGVSVLLHYKSSPIRALQELYPDIEWQEWRFSSPPKHFWTNKAHRRRFLEWLGGELGYRQPSDWYQLTVEIVISKGGRGILRNNGLHVIMREFIPTYDWIPWLFTAVPNGFWQTRQNQVRYLEWFCERMHITKTEDWYRIRAADFYNHKGAGFLDCWEGSVMKLALAQYPDVPWDFSRFKDGMKGQKQIYALVVELFGRTNVRWNYKHPSLRFSVSGHRMELDIFVPMHKFAIEYQGEQHFRSIDHWGGDQSLEALQKRDEEKRIACLQQDIHLMEIRFDDKRDMESLRQAILGCFYCNNG